jgi:mRNA interferase RelE/StbE
VEIIFTKSALKEMSRLDAVTYTRITDAVNRLPSGDIKKLKGMPGNFRLRVGGYRVIFKLQEAVILVGAVRPRGEAYNK